jgi:hypothetical protein
MTSYDPWADVFSWLKALLGIHAARLRAARRCGDSGASAVELAIITAVMVGVAAGLVLIIRNFVKTQQGKITNNVVP